jgi:hypothetical protein
MRPPPRRPHRLDRWSDRCGSPALCPSRGGRSAIATAVAFIAGHVVAWDVFSFPGQYGLLSGIMQ